MKYLLVGDVHAMASDLEDAQNLLDYCKEIVINEKVDVCFFSGDLFNYFNIVHLPVVKFWNDNIESLAAHCKVIALVGNHDFGAGNMPAHALLPYKKIKNVLIVDQPTVFDNKLFLPYYGSKQKQEFIDICNEYSFVDTLFCHETFDGAQFENGFYAKDGIDQNLIPQSTIYAGHIHKMSQVGKVTYIGSPRWLTVSDANHDKFLWLEDFDNDESKMIATGRCCSRIVHLTLNESEPLPEIIIRPQDRLTVDLHGSQAFIHEMSKSFKSAKIRSFPTKSYASEVRESDGIWTAFDKFTSKFKPKYNTSSEALLDMAKTRLRF